MTETELAGLGSQGWFVREGFASAAEAAPEARARAALDPIAGLALRPAGLAGGLDPAVRNDRFAWVLDGDRALAPLRAGFEDLRVELNADAWLGLVRFDVQLAHFPGGGSRYVRHHDAIVGGGGRRVTAIVYLNADWGPADGGELRLHVAEPVSLAPVLGRMVVFLSERVEHEVLPAFASRLAATAWFYARP